MGIQKLASLLWVGPARETNDPDDVTALEVFVLLFEGSFASGVLQLTHDLNRDALLFGHVELKSVATLALRDDPDSDTHLIVLQSLALLEIFVLLDKFG